MKIEAAPSSPVKRPYAPPTLRFLGTIAELTHGPGGSLIDGSLGNTKPMSG
jgi:hypothetical protein